MSTADVGLRDVISLRLKKPKSWNWELSTSKSSPHILLPIIKLYDYKGNLVLETKDTGCNRRSWHSGDQTPWSHPGENNLTTSRCFKGGDVRTTSKQEGSISRTENNNERVESPKLDERTHTEDRRGKSDEAEENEKRPVYKTRTSSAGTLIISEESFGKSNRRRRRSRLENSSEKLSKRPSTDSKYSYRVSFPTTDDDYSLGVFLENRADPRENEDKKMLRRRKHRRRKSDSNSGGSDDACVKRNPPKSEAAPSIFNAPVTGSSSADLLDLVRHHLTARADRHVNTMGANVSRHSSKGLSGRRSQSSGSICNGKSGKHGDGKGCGSLPSYLDERNAEGCNNNHDGEKVNFDDVPRIPPLGDGAPLHWKFSDTQTALCDQGYGSERSPEEEYPPPMPDHVQCLRHLEPHTCYPFVTPESTFLVKLSKGSRGLGLSVTGGIDSGGSWPGLIRIKRLFPHQPASQCGLINVGDLLLEANGITLTGLTNYEALEVLRTAANQVELRICRPPPDVLTCVSPISEIPPPPPRRDAAGDSNAPSLGCFSSPEDDYYHGEFEIVINKIQGSLGFTLRKEDDSALGHYVRALVREPALTDGRIKAGDKIIAVNDVEISPMSHEQAVQFLRQCGEEVKLRLYRDAAQTPVAALSPTETTPRTSFSRKSNLRQEAVDMLNDIAVRKLTPGNQDTYRRSHSPSASPRRLRRPTQHPSDASQETDHSSITTKYPLVANDSVSNEQFHEGMVHYAHPFSDDASLFIVDSAEEGDDDRPSRPSSLDLYNPNQTPVVARKPRFNFSLAHNAYELNNLDAEVLDAPNLTYNLGHEEGKGPDHGRTNDSFGQGPASMPHIPLDNTSSGSGFSHKNPAYQTAHPPCVTEDHPQNPVRAPPPPPAPSSARYEDDNTQMRKWRGAPTVDEYDEPRLEAPMEFAQPREESEILAIELNRGWNSRLGFSLQGAAGVTYVSAVYANSVAAKDGRLKPGDRVLKVNDESVEHMSTPEIIDLLRIVRGPVCIVVSRTNTKEDCAKSNAVN